jgi:hypothetical protein
MKLGWVAAALLVYTALVIQHVMPRLPNRIPTRFGWHGLPTAWSSPDTLWIMLAAQAAGTLLILAIPFLGRRMPQLVNLGTRRLSDFPPRGRERVMPLLEDMSGWMAALFSLFFTLLIRGLIRAALEAGPGPSMWPVAAFLAGMGAVVFYYLRQFNRIWKEETARGASPRLPPR